MNKLEGTGVALVTPFNANNQIDYPALRKLLKHTAKGVDYYVVMGTTGEAATVTQEEKKQVLEFVKQNNPKGLPIVYGIGGNNTQAVIESIRHTDFSGITAVLSVSPYYNKPSQAGIVAHFRAVADACPVPIILYNVPGRTASNLTAETTLQLAEHPNIIGIKEASGNLEQCMRISRYKPKNFMLISGDDLLTVVLYSIGGQGVISVLANAFPEIFKRARQECQKGNYVRASQQLFKLLEINGLMYEEGNPTGVKQLLAEMGLCSPHVRLPLAAASASLRQRIGRALEGIKKG
jgi:4-hydroxy-tetrahydrodipicolinate synthase